MVNFTELLHIADLRLCWRAQWEIRHMVALMRREVVKAVPELGGQLQPKCGDRRMGYCDEPLDEWKRCPIGKVRPHKEQLFEILEQHRTARPSRSPRRTSARSRTRGTRTEHAGERASNRWVRDHPALLLSLEMGFC